MSATVYRVLSDDGELLYVGRSVNPLSRLHSHSLQKPWWGDATRVEITHFETLEQAIDAEAEAIRSEGARYNVTGRPVPADVLEKRRIRRQERLARWRQREVEDAAAFFRPGGSVVCGECGCKPFKLPKGQPVQGGVCPECGNAALRSTEAAA